MNLPKDLFLDETPQTILAGKSALVTGATSGIGLATSAWLAREGVHLFLVGRRNERLNEIKEELKNRFPNVKVTLCCMDVTSPNAVQELDQLNALDVDIFINNAGLAIGKSPIADLATNEIDAVVNTNVTSAIKIASAVTKKMVAKKSGHIVNLGSVAGHYTYVGGSVYCASKFAVRAFNEALRQEMHEHNVRVTLISPGMVETEFSLVRFQGDKEKATAVYENMDCLRPADIAKIILEALKKPKHVCLDEILVLPTTQSPVTYKVKRN